MSVKNAFSPAFISAGEISSILRTTHPCPLMRSAICSASVGRAITLSANAPMFFVGTAPRAWSSPNSPAQNFPSSFRKRENSSFFPMSDAWSAMTSRHFTPARSASSSSCIRSISVIAVSLPPLGWGDTLCLNRGSRDRVSSPSGCLVEFSEQLPLAHVVHHRALFHGFRRLPGTGKAAVAVIFPEHLLGLGVRPENLSEDVVRPDRLPAGEGPRFRLFRLGGLCRGRSRLRRRGRDRLVQLGHHVVQIHVVPLARHPQRDRDLLHLLAVLRVREGGEAVPHEDVHGPGPRGEDLSHPHVRVDLRRGGGRWSRLGGRRRRALRSGGNGRRG